MASVSLCCLLSVQGHGVGDLLALPVPPPSPKGTQVRRSPATLPWPSVCPAICSFPPGDHAGGLGGHHVLRHGCPLLLQFHLLHSAHHREYGWGRMFTARGVSVWRCFCVVTANLRCRSSLVSIMLAPRAIHELACAPNVPSQPLLSLMGPYIEPQGRGSRDPGLPSCCQTGGLGAHGGAGGFHAATTSGGKWAGVGGQASMCGRGEPASKRHQHPKASHGQVLSGGCRRIRTPFLGSQPSTVYVTAQARFSTVYVASGMALT